MAPFAAVPLALVLVDEAAEAEALPEEDEVAFELVPLAMAWKSAKDFAAVGFTAKTMPD